MKTAIFLSFCSPLDSKPLILGQIWRHEKKLVCDENGCQEKPAKKKKALPAAILQNQRNTGDDVNYSNLPDQSQ